MNNGRTGQRSANLFKNYNRLIGVAYTLLIIALTLFFGYLLDRKMTEEIELIRGHVARHGQFFEFVLRSAADQLETFRMSASFRREQASPSALTLLAHPPGAWLREDQRRGLFNLDALPDRDASGNLVGIGSLQRRSHEFYEDLATALRLNSDWSSLTFTLPNAVEARFVSTHQFHAVLPWQPSEELPFDPKVYSSPVWAMAQPAVNPDRTKYWAPVYFAGKDRGLVVPVAVPLYQDQRFVGVLSIDTSIDYLNRINADFNYPLGFNLLLDQRRQVLTHPTLYANPLEVNTTPGVARAVPEALVGELDRLSQLPSGHPTRINGYLVIRYALISAPWSLFYIVPESALWLRLGSHMGAPMAGVLLGLAFLMGLTYILTSREFVGPAAKLVRHIAAESNFEPATIPVVPSGWRPWFEAVTQAFRESMQLISLRQELVIAASMQQSILPRHWPEHPRYALWGTMRSAREVGGDFYDHFEVDESLRGIVVADVSGKGISAGLFGMVSKTLLRSAATRGDLPIGAMIASVNDSLAEDNENCMFVTVFYARLDPARGWLEFVNAGHPPPLLIHADGRIAWLPLTGGMAMGAMDGIDYQASVVQLQPGEMLLIFSDGVTEAMTAADEEFGTQRLANLFDGTPPTNPRETVERVLAAVDRFADGFEQSDDITCIALQYHGGGMDPTATSGAGEAAI
jgi:phosphoserine phosphatase RsbU/P